MDIDISALPSVSIHRRVDMPNISAVYFILGDDNAPLYIGQSYLMRNRWEAHPKKKQAVALGGWRVAWKSVPSEQLLEVELFMIQRFDPPLNTRGRPRNRPAPSQ